jgi:superfamily II DNA or RNA helicase
MTWTPRPGQARTLAAMREAARAGNRRICVALPTGAGKTHLACWRIAEQQRAGLRVCVIVHRREIMRQWRATLAEHGGSVGAVVWRTQQARSALPECDVYWVDEAHLYYDQIQRLQAQAAGAWWVLLTATPWRLSGEPMSAVADVIVAEQTVAELEAEGSLVPARVLSGRSPDLHTVPTRGGDYTASGLAIAYQSAQLVGDIVETWASHALYRPTLLFASSVEQSRSLVASLGPGWAHVDGSTPARQRAETWAMLDAGELHGVSSVQLAIEGIDVRRVSCVVWARATKSLSIWLQGCGRAARCHADSGKRDYLVIDHGGNVWEHGLPGEARAWTLDGTPPTAPGVDPLRTCGECLAVYDAAEAVDGCCPRCGAAPDVQQRPPRRVRAGELVEITAAELERRRRDVSRQTPPRPPPAWLPERLHRAWERNEERRQREGYALPVAGEGGWSEARARYAMR